MTRGTFFLWLPLLMPACHDPARPNYEFVPEMVDSVAYESFSQNPVTHDGKTLQAAPLGTIARGATPFHYGSGKEEAIRAGAELTNPIPKTKEAVSRGEKVFRRICASCHGATGQGDGPVIPRFPMPPSLTAAHATGLPDGQIFHIIWRGQGLMPPHAVQMSMKDAWNVVWFIRSLEEAKP